MYKSLSKLSLRIKNFILLPCEKLRQPLPARRGHEIHSPFGGTGDSCRITQNIFRPSGDLDRAEAPVQTIRSAGGQCRSHCENQNRCFPAKTPRTMLQCQHCCPTSQLRRTASSPTTRTCSDRATLSDNHPARVAVCCLPCCGKRPRKGQRQPSRA